jgi:hypothetical protein
MKEKLGILYGNTPGYGISSLSRPLLDRKIQVQKPNQLGVHKIEGYPDDPSP